ncbi:MAG TPA: GyrI-like domain-containing protein [Cyclobacteriaceae bacterium]|nr:GyrI-like domain-containing protein [Cyclobacteriaceae bacterium]
MNIELRENLELHVYGFSAPVPNFQFGDTGTKLSDRVWSFVKENSLPNKGINIWVYDDQGKMFCGVELDPPPVHNFGMEERDIVIKKYAQFVHVGPYRLLKEVNDKMKDEMKNKGIKFGPPSLEIYGHNHPDEQKLETTIIYTIG